MRTRRCGRLAAAVLMAVALASCATRPGPEVLATVAAPPGVKTLPIYVATTRKRESPSQNVFTSDRAGALNYARFAIAIPPGHKSGLIEWPTGKPDPMRSFAAVDQAVLSEAEFRKAITAPRRRGQKHKVLIFVHGFNNNFQESLFRLAQMQADANVDGTPILFAWPSRGAVAAYETDKEAALYSRDYLMQLLTMVTSSPQVGEVIVVAHSMGGMLTAEALRQLRIQRKDRVIARLGKVVLAAPDIDAPTFRAQMETIGPLHPPLTLLVSKDDRALLASSLLGGTLPRAGALDIDNPIVREAALKAKIQIVDISRLASHDGLHHDRFVSVAALYSRLQTEAGANRDKVGTFIMDASAQTVARPVDTMAEAHAH